VFEGVVEDEGVGEGLVFEGRDLEDALLGVVLLDVLGDIELGQALVREGRILLAGRSHVRPLTDVPNDGDLHLDLLVNGVPVGVHGLDYNDDLLVDQAYLVGDQNNVPERDRAFPILEHLLFELFGVCHQEV